MNIIHEQLSGLGVMPGDIVLMHSSYNALGGAVSADEFLRNALEYIGAAGVLMLPAFTYETAFDNRAFDARADASCVGYLTNAFRRLPGVYRSAHPTHSVCARGRLARELTEAHARDDTPVGANSPIRRLAELGGKILFVGKVSHACTFMHGVEEIAGAPYCLQNSSIEFAITDMHGRKYSKMYVCHDFKGIRQRYSRIADVVPCARGKLLSANALMVEARPLMDAALAKMREDVYYFVEKCDGKAI